MKYVMYLLAFVFGTYVNYLIQKSVDISPNVFTIFMPGVVGGIAGWWYVRRMNKIKKCNLLDHKDL